MSKKTKPINTRSTAANIKAVDINPIIEKYFWIVIPVLTVIYFIISRYSVGFYQDDEVAQYINMVQFWSDPWIILGNNPKPGYKIFMVLPTLISYDAVLIMNAFIASLAVYFTYVLIKVYNIKYAFFGALLLAFQPLFFDLSFRSYSEIFTALCIVIFLMLYGKEKYFWSGLVCGYIFSVRQEIALLILVLAIIFFRKKEYKAVAALFIFPVIYNLLGFIKTGDIMFVLTEMQNVAGLNYKSQGLMHYFKVYIFIVGPVALSLFLAGFFGFFNNMDSYKDYLKKYFLFYITFISIFVIQMMTMINDGPNPGNWRYLLHISPICAVFATIGLNNLSDKAFRKTFYILTGILAFVTLIFLSKGTDGFILTDKADYTKIIVVAVLFLMVIMLWSDSKIKYLNSLSIALVILSAVSLAFSFEPRKLSEENLTIKESAALLDNEGGGNVQVLSNHSLLPFFMKSYRKDPDLLRPLNSKTLQEAPSGSMILWETHYGDRSKDWGNKIWKDDNIKYVSIESIMSDSTFQPVKKIDARDRSLQVFIFKKK